MANPVPSLEKSNALLAIVVGGVVGGSLDLLQACILFGWQTPLFVAGGLVGLEAAGNGGAGMYILGISLHFFIALSVAAIYYGASRRLVFLRQNWLVCGLFFGIAVELVMRLIVLPLCALHAKGPYTWGSEIQGLVVHMLLIGLPISFSVRRFAGATTRITAVRSNEAA